jgi:hypothetical protein
VEEVYSPNYVERVGKAIMEAWAWMMAAGLLAHDPRQQSGDFVFITRRAEAITDPAEFEAFRKGSLLPRALNRPGIARGQKPSEEGA